MCPITTAVHCVRQDNKDNKITKEANPEPEAFNEMLFADDQSFTNEDEKKKKLQKQTNSLNTTCEEYDTKISISQTETMKVSRTHSKLNNLTGKSKHESRKQTMSATSSHHS